MPEHEKPMMDERVQQESAAILAKNYLMAMLLLGLLMLAKAAGLLMGLPWYALAPEAAGLLTGGMVCAAWMTARGLWGAVDERVAVERARCLSASWTAAHCAALLTATALLILDHGSAWLYALTMLAMALVQYMTLGRMTRGGLYAGSPRGRVWKRALLLTAAVLLIAPGMMWAMGMLRHQTYPAWAYAALEAILLAACLLGAVLADRMTARSGREAEKALAAAEETDEE